MGSKKYAFLSLEEYAKESIKDLKINQGAVFDKNATGSTLDREVKNGCNVACFAVFYAYFTENTDKIGKKA